MGSGMAVRASTMERGSGAAPVVVQRHFGDQIGSALFILPAAAVLCFTSVYPLIYSFWLSLHNWNMMIPRSKPVWNGLDNYRALWHDDDFWNSLRVTLIFVVFAVTIEFVLGMGVALIVTSRIRAVGLVRTVMLFPLMVAPVVAGVLW